MTDITRRFLRPTSFRKGPKRGARALSPDSGLEPLESRELLSQGVSTAPYQLIGVIPVPGKPLTEFDISVVDSTTHRLYFADRANGGIDIIDTRSNTLLSRVPGFAGPGSTNGGPQGVVLVGHNEIWASDGHSSVKVIQLNANHTAGAIVDSISTGGQFRGDEVAYDPRDHIVIVVNNDDTPPFISFVSTDPAHRGVVARINFPYAGDGVEQPLYDPANGMIYVSIPEINANPLTGAIAEINPRTHALSLFPLSGIAPSGLALGPHQELLVNNNGDGIKAGSPPVSEIISARDGHVIATIAGIGGSDEVWYNPGNNLYFEADRSQPGGGVLAIIDARTHTLLQTIPTSTGSKSVSADSSNGEVFVPLPPSKTDPRLVNGGIGVYSQDR